MLKVKFLLILITINRLVPAHGQYEITFLYNNYIKVINNSLTNEEISIKCRKQLSIFYDGLLSQQLWALQMFDAKSKFPSGVLYGRYFDLGNFDECLNVENKEIQGKYCLGTLSFPENTIHSLLNITKGDWPRGLGRDKDPKFAGFHFATCVPNKCTAQDVNRIHPVQYFDEKYCYSKETQPKLTWGPITAIAIFGIFLVLVIVSTFYDIFLHYTKKKPGHDITVAFSFLTNGKKLIDFSSNQNQILCLNGIKAISMIWIVALHEFAGGATGPVANSLYRSQIIRDPLSMYAVGGNIAVDTFFVTGGLVMVYTFLKSANKGVKFNLLSYYAHRYIRLTPAVAVMIVVYATLLKHLGDGPLWNSFDGHLVEPCRKYWWTTLLYIQNYVHDDDMCVPHTWYLAVDMQFFIFSPLILLPMKKKPKHTLVALILLTLAGIVIPFLVAYFEDLGPYMLSHKDKSRKYLFMYYSQAYTRFGPYVMGTILGYFIYKLKSGEIKIKLGRFSVVALWSVCLTGMLSCVYAGYGLRDSDYDRWSHSLHIAFNRPAWALAISFVIFACVTGHGGPINAFLSASIFQFLSKISYAIYLVHYAVIFLRAASYKTDISVGHFYFMTDFWADFMFSLILSLLLYLVFESPMITIEKCVFHKRSQGNDKSKLNS